MAQQIAHARFASMQEEIESRAKSLGWELMKKMNVERQVIARWFGTSTLFLTYMRRMSWRSGHQPQVRGTVTRGERDVG